jgi:hypothetical protein
MLCVEKALSCIKLCERFPHLVTTVLLSQGKKLNPLGCMFSRLIGCMHILFLNMDATIFFFASANKVIHKVRRLGGENGQLRHNKASNA